MNFLHDHCSEAEKEYNWNYWLSLRNDSEPVDPFSRVPKCIKEKTMTCKICGRIACAESFHSLAEQEEFETKTGRYTPETDKEKKDEIRAVADDTIQGHGGPMAEKRVRPETQYPDTHGLTPAELREIYE